MNNKFKKAILVSLTSIALTLSTIEIIDCSEVREYTLEEDSDLIGLRNESDILVNLSTDNKSSINLDEEKQVLEKVGELYIDNGDIDKKTIVAVAVNAKGDYHKDIEKYKTESTDEIAEKIVDDNEKNNLVDINIKCREIRQETIDPEVTVIEDENMYMGQVREEEGKAGCKEVISNVNYVNGIKKGEEILSEKILLDSVNTVIHKGAKSPIEDGVAFLEHPTRGGQITSNFGRRWGKDHNGIDISHNIGDAVYAASDGVVTECGYVNGYGNKITISHGNNIKTVYAHLSKFNVSIGDKVKEGDLIGKVGNTGNSTGPHLHFELRINGAPIDPINYIKV